MSKTPIVLPDAADAAVKMTVTGWVSRNGRFYGDDERLARWDGSTHRRCDACAGIMEKQSYCASCHHKKTVERFNALPIVDWDGECLLADYDGDNYWRDPEDFLCWCADNEIEDPHEIMLVATEPVRMRLIDADYWTDDLPEDGDLPGDIQDAVDALNKMLMEHKPFYWKPAPKRIKIDVPADYGVEP